MHQSKQGKVKESREVVGIGRNKKRVDLSKEFEEFKQRIQEFENKNEEIISRIRDAYTVKKKATQQPEYPAPYPNYYPHPNPNVNPAQHHYYQNNDVQSVTSSCDYSKDVVFEGSMAKHHPAKPARSIYNSQAEEEVLRQNLSVQHMPSSHSTRHYQGTYEDYMRGQGVRLRTEEERPPLEPDPTYSGRFGTADPHLQHQNEEDEHHTQLEEQYREAVARSEQLEEQLHEREEEIAKLRGGEGRVRSSMAAVRRQLEAGLDSVHLWVGSFKRKFWGCASWK